jgi:hypothetical protein
MKARIVNENINSNFELHCLLFPLRNPTKLQGDIIMPIKGMTSKEKQLQFYNWF